MPWIRSPEGGRAGIAEPDGVIVLAAAVAAYLLSLAGIRWAWVVAGFAATIAVRDLVIVLRAEGVAVGVGLWLTAGALVLETVRLLGLLIAQVLEGRAGGGRARPDGRRGA